MPDEIDRVKFLREEIKFEHKQIADRLSPFVTAQSFVTTAFAISAQNDDHTYSKFVWYAYFVVIPFGFLSGLLVLCAIGVGVYRLFKLRKMLFETCDQEVRRWFLPDSSPTAHSVSLFYAFGLPILTMIMWAIVFLYGMTLLGYESATREKQTITSTVKSSEVRQNETSAIDHNATLKVETVEEHIKK